MQRYAECLEISFKFDFRYGNNSKKETKDGQKVIVQYYGHPGSDN